MAISEPRLTRLIRRDFGASADHVLKLLAELAARHPGDAMFSSERLQAAVVLLAGGGSPHRAIELAETDWRDLLVATDLADADWPHKLDQLLGQ
ncbi:hypothetical protein LWC34_01375 [Kibdelosporangium philippinense]|uniref:Uncharacterized protein n=1 Tax=Kibdelosporangium philippinense TaxID=211113 RepID=A0ABS8Z3B1_9PSEU|nr:hypothetical protein [Kibdelosporangium philippinense]MCE7001498.1 hypothetical protein [Kibdelosporangium philippinense]